jgi:excisionase family DNA binding protein
VNGPDRSEVTRREFEAMRVYLERVERENRELAERVAQLEAAARPSVYTPQTLAAQLGITPRAVRAAIERGDLKARRSGRGYVIGADAVAAWARPATRRMRRRPARPSAERHPLRDAMAGIGDS